MNCLNNSSEKGGAGAGTEMGTEAETRARIRARTSLEPGIGLQDGAGEVLLEWKPPTGPGSLASSSSIGSRGRRFR